MSKRHLFTLCTVSVVPHSVVLGTTRCCWVEAVLPAEPEKHGMLALLRVSRKVLVVEVQDELLHLEAKLLVEQRCRVCGGDVERHVFPHASLVAESGIRRPIIPSRRFASSMHLLPSAEPNEVTSVEKLSLEAKHLQPCLVNMDAAIPRKSRPWCESSIITNCGQNTHINKRDGLWPLLALHRLLCLPSD